MSQLYYILAQQVQVTTNLPHTPLTRLSVMGALRVIFALAGALAVIFVAYGGFKYIMSQGNSSEVAKAKDTIMYALIGMAVAFGAFAIISFVTGTLLF